MRIERLANMAWDEMWDGIANLSFYRGEFGSLRQISSEIAWSSHNSVQLNRTITVERAAAFRISR
jgi:hypothetical protein